MADGDQAGAADAAGGAAGDAGKPTICLKQLWMKKAMQLDVPPLHAPDLKTMLASLKKQPMPPPPKVAVPPLTAALPKPSDPAPEQADPQLTADGVEYSKDVDLPTGTGTVQVLPSLSVTARTPYTGGAIGPDLKGPVNSVEAGATLVKIGSEKVNLHLDVSAEYADGKVAPHATAQLDAQLSETLKLSVKVDEKLSPGIRLEKRF